MDSPSNQKGLVIMNNDSKLENGLEDTGENDSGSAKPTRNRHKFGSERRSGIDRRSYSYTLHIPERRRGPDRRMCAGLA